MRAWPAKRTVQHIETAPLKLSNPLRILAVSNTSFGGNDFSYVEAFLRASHSVIVAAPEACFPKWGSKSLRVLRRTLVGRITAEFNKSILEAAEWLRPDLFFVFKGRDVMPDTVRQLSKDGVVTINYWPDVSFRAHGRYPPLALPVYDWVFTSKSFGLVDLREQLGIENASFLPHAFDPKLHKPVLVDPDKDAVLGCDVSFIGNWSPKKEQLLEGVARANNHLKLHIWGPKDWLRAGRLMNAYQGHPMIGLEYARAVCASKINLCILSERRSGASSGDLTTARTFEIPGIGGFMIHERTAEAMEYFTENKECVFFNNAEDLNHSIGYYLARPAERRAIAKAGNLRVHESGYSYDSRVRTVIDKFREITSSA